MQFLSIVAVCVFSAILYGILHDQITARICVEYFTIGHPPVFGTDDPTLLGLGWGVIATWWVGVLLGVPLACAARLGRGPKRSALSLIQPLFILMVISAICAAISSLVGASLARAGLVRLIEPLATAVPTDRHVAFLTDLWAHNGSYASGFIGGAVIIWRVWSKRRQLPQPQP